MTSQEFYEKYKDVKFVLSSYNKYTFQFVGDYEGNQVTVCVGDDHFYNY